MPDGGVPAGRDSFLAPHRAAARRRPAIGGERQHRGDQPGARSRLRNGGAGAPAGRGEGCGRRPDPRCHPRRPGDTHPRGPGRCLGDPGRRATPRQPRAPSARQRAPSRREGRHMKPSGGRRGAREGRNESRAAVLGAGSWGTALALHLARTGIPTTLWTRSEGTAAVLRDAGENAAYLAGHRFPPDLEVTSELSVATRDTRLVMFVVPAQFCRPVFRAAAPHLPPAADLLIASKGIEEGTLLRLTEVLAQEAGGAAGGRGTVLSGPSFAAEVARGDPTAVVVASEDMRAAAGGAGAPPPR